MYIIYIYKYEHYIAAMLAISGTVSLNIEGSISKIQGSTGDQSRWPESCPTSRPDPSAGPWEIAGESAGPMVDHFQ